MEGENGGELPEDLENITWEVRGSHGDLIHTFSGSTGDLDQAELEPGRYTVETDFDVKPQPPEGCEVWGVGDCPPNPCEDDPELCDPPKDGGGDNGGSDDDGPVDPEGDVSCSEDPNCVPKNKCEPGGAYDCHACASEDRCITTDETTDVEEQNPPADDCGAIAEALGGCGGTGGDSSDSGSEDDGYDYPHEERSEEEPEEPGGFGGGGDAGSAGSGGSGGGTGITNPFNFW